MILSKKILTAVALTLTTIITTIILVYLARVTIVESFSKERLALYQVKITCADFHLTTDLTLMVTSLCLQTPQADIKIEDMAVAFTLTTEPKIKYLEIAALTIKGTADLFPLLKSKPNKNSDVTLAQQLDYYLTQLEQVNLPFNINIAALHYAPFAQESNKITNSDVLATTTRYLGKFSVVENTVEFSLNDTQSTGLLTAKLSNKNSKNKSPLTLKISGQLTQLKHFLFLHKLPLSPEILDALAAINASGEFHSLFSYQSGQLTLASQLTALSLATTHTVGASGPFALTGALNLSSLVSLTEENATINRGTDFEGKLEVEFQQENTLQLQYSHQHLIDYLNKNAVSSDVIALLINNPVNQLTFSPSGKLTYHLENQQMSLSSIALKAKDDQQFHKLNVDNMVLDLHYYLTGESVNETPSVAQLDFTLDSALLLSAVSKFTDSPVALKLQGSINQNQTQTTIKVNENSSFTSSNIAISTRQKTTNKKLLAIKQLTTQLQGDIQFQTPIQVRNDKKKPKKQNINVNLIINSLAKKLRIDELIEVKALALTTKVTGNLHDIKIDSTATADNIPLGHLVLSGAIEQIDIALTAKNIQLTDLLSLNIKLPQKVVLVEGELSYSVKGQVTDLKNIQNTPLVLSVAITSLSGEIEDIWIQELNWQQKFTWVAGEFSTLDDTSDHSNENLTVALIDTPTPISKLSISTAWHYKKDFKISATKLKGNLLGGSFAIPKIQWPLEHGHSVDVQLTSIDLEQVLALDKKQGIVVTGNISGHLPVSFDGEKYTMEKGELHNVSNGLIQVINNPAVKELKASNTQLQLAFDALQNLHYHQLSSDVSMADDGYMLLETVIKGRNPDLDNDVNLNLNLSYDLLGLLESMSITERFEKRIIKGLQKH